MKTKLMTILAVITTLALSNAAQSAEWSFVMLGDTRDDNSTATGVSPHLHTIAQKIASLNPQLVLVAGDLCNGDCLDPNSPLYPANGNFTDLAAKAIYAGEFSCWKTAMQPVFNYATGEGIPIYTVRGNHENNDAEAAPIEVLKEAYQEAFSAYVPTNGPNNGPADNQRGLSWSFTHNNVTFAAAATGDGAVTYRWQTNGVNLSNSSHFGGCTTATLTVTSTAVAPMRSASSRSDSVAPMPCPAR